ncbi:Meiotic expression up-regulated protein 26 [Stagonosporopsis vannaccii]|nr:Meiotic expression up-regulated protein 26 [Stagonosporopsis vannaccii]
MEFNAIQQYRPSSSKSTNMGQSSPTSATQMYAHSNYAIQRHQPPPLLQHMSKSSPPHSTWAVPQSHNSYYAGPRGPTAPSRDEHAQFFSRSDMNTSEAPAYNNMTLSNSMATSAEFFPNVIDTSPWGAKGCEELESFPSLDTDATDFNHGLIGQDENTPIIDLRQFQGIGHQDTDSLTHFNPQGPRRMSESSFSMSSTGGGMFPDVSSYEDMSSSEAVSYTNDCDGWNPTEATGGHLMSPIASPRKSQYDTVARTGGRARMSPAPHNHVRSSPYTLESTRFKRWSTGQAPTSTPSNPRAVAQIPDHFAPYGSRPNPHHSMPVYPPSAMANFGMPPQNVLFSQNHQLQSNGPPLYVTRDQPFPLEVPRPLPSQGLFRLLQSNVDRHGGCSSHFADLSDPPDLYSSLHEQPSDPPESDMNPSDPDLVPHEQDLRFNGDLYTPRWVRGHGNKREGWCGLCKPGRWLVLKNSAFWYDKSFTHGVSAATGAAFQGPQDTRRTEGNLDVWEGLCGSCGEWIALVSSKKKGTTWFRHAYKCHTHPKVKDGPKRRRETQAGRARAVSSASTSSSSHPVKQELTPAHKTSHRHSTPTPIPGSSTLHTFNLPVSTPTATPSISTPSYGSSTSHPTPAAATPLLYAPQTPTTSTSLHALHTPTAAAFPELRYDTTSSKDEHVARLFPTPFQGFPNFSTAYSAAPSINLAHQISEPELMGIRATAASLNSIASMM